MAYTGPEPEKVVQQWYLRVAVVKRKPGKTLKEMQDAGGKGKDKVKDKKGLKGERFFGFDNGAYGVSVTLWDSLDNLETGDKALKEDWPEMEATVSEGQPTVTIIPVPPGA